VRKELLVKEKELNEFESTFVSEDEEVRWGVERIEEIRSELGCVCILFCSSSLTLYIYIYIHMYIYNMYQSFF
jgi:hypothetical protein